MVKVTEEVEKILEGKEVQENIDKIEEEEKMLQNRLRMNGIKKMKRIQIKKVK